MTDAQRPKRLSPREGKAERTERLASFPLLNPNPVLEVDVSGKIIFANPAAHRVLKSLGLDSRDPRPFLPADMEVILKKLAKGKGVPLRREVTIGNRVFGETINPIPGLNAARIYSADITERVKAEEALRRNEERLTRAQEIAHLGGWELDLIVNRLTWSDEVYRIFGLRPQEFDATYEAFLERVHPDDRQAVDTAYSSSLRENLNSYEIEHRVVRKDTGEIRFVHEKCEHFRDASGRIVRSVGMVHDITERKNAEKAVVEGKSLLETVFSSMNEAVVVVDKAGQIIHYNDAFAYFCRFRNREECLGSVSEFAGIIRAYTLDGKPLPVEEWPALRALKGEAAANCEYLLERIDTGETWFASTNFAPLRDKSGDIIGAVQGTRDVTELKHAEKILRRSREELEELVRQRTEEIKKKDDFIRRAQKIEALGTLAGGIAHDFNNILSTIMINAEIALLDQADHAPNQGPLPLILAAAHRGRELVKQIITFSRQREHERKPIRIAPVVRDALKFLRSSMPTSIEIHEDVEEAADVVLADPSQIHQIVMNLCVNAAHAMRERGGLLEVSLKAVDVDADVAAKHQELQPGPYLRLAVTDTGCGMTPEVMERVFDPFFTTKGPGEGSGLGLSVVHGVVQSYGGGVVVYSEPGRGSAFKVFLPRAPGEQEPGRAKAEIVPGTGERILLVEDEAVQLQSFAAMLERLGYAVTARRDGGEALAVFEINPGDFDLVITDQTMPKMTGGQLAEAILRIRPGLPIILCTGFSDVVSGERAKLIGIREFIFKPFSLCDISATIRRALASPDRAGEEPPRAG